MPSVGDITAAVRDAVDPTSLLQRVADRTLEIIPAAAGVAIGLVSGRSVTYVCGAGDGGAPSVGTTVEVHASLSGLAVQSGRIVRSHDTQRDPRVDAAACHRLAVASLVCIPLCRAHEMFGVMAVNAPVTHAFSEADVAALTRLADFVSMAVGSACDLHRASSQLLESGRPPAEAGASTDPPGTSDDATGRYVMGVLDPDAADRMESRLRVRHVLDHPDVIGLVFQPIVDLLSDQAVAVEALARFNAIPIRPPDMWFADARRAGLGLELEMLAVTRALEQLGGLPDTLSVTINAGPETIVSSQLRRALLDLPARRIVLELTEHTAFDDYPALAGTLMALRRAGIRIAVDDAGSGYSSLTHILQLAPDFIKLDRELVTGIDVDPVRRALVTSLVTFAGDTGAEILAEGVETKDELQAVRRLGVRYAQGYYLGRPVPLAALTMQHAPNVYR